MLGDYPRERDDHRRESRGCAIRPPRRFVVVAKSDEPTCRSSIGVEGKAISCDRVAGESRHVRRPLRQGSRLMIAGSIDLEGVRVAGPLLAAAGRGSAS
jgi:hypothetical protein